MLECFVFWSSKTILKVIATTKKPLSMNTHEIKGLFIVKTFDKVEYLYSLLQLSNLNQDIVFHIQTIQGDLHLTLPRGSSSWDPLMCPTVGPHSMVRSSTSRTSFPLMGPLLHSHYYPKGISFRSVHSILPSILPRWWGQSFNISLMVRWGLLDLNMPRIGPHLIMDLRFSILSMVSSSLSKGRNGQMCEIYECNQ